MDARTGGCRDEGASIDERTGVGWMDEGMNGRMDEEVRAAETVSTVEGSGPADSERSIRVVCITVQYTAPMSFLAFP